MLSPEENDEKWKQRIRARVSEELHRAGCRRALLTEGKKLINIGMLQLAVIGIASAAALFVPKEYAGLASGIIVATLIAFLWTAHTVDKIQRQYTKMGGKPEDWSKL